MFFDDDDNAFFNPGILPVVVRRELFITTNLENTPYGLRSVPTHTEDGIPIRKLYVTNLPPKTTRTELFGVFAQYGFIRSCWLRMGDNGPNKSPIPTYAFVTFSDPADAHKALLAPCHEKNLRGRNLKISPADTWHQPVEDGELKTRRKPKHSHDVSEDCSKAEGTEKDNNKNDTTKSASSSHDSNSNKTEENPDVDEDTCHESQMDTDHNYLVTFNILEVLNRDCLHHVFSYIPIRDLIRSEGVSKSWRNAIQEYLDSVRLFKTSWWQHVPVPLTTAVLRRVLQRLGALLRLHIDHHWSALNDRTAHTVGKFCPSLEELKVVGMQTKNWNPLIYGCKNLKQVSFVSCNKLTDSSLVHIVKSDSCIESITLANNTHVTGLFLTGANPPKLSSLSFYNCYSLQGTVLNAALDGHPTLKCLKLDVCPVTMWKIIPLILMKLPRLEELSLSDYTSIESKTFYMPEGNSVFCDAIGNLTELRILNLTRNVYITNSVLKQVGQSCSKLESLNISGCNPRKGFPDSLPGVSDEGVRAVCGGCGALRRLDVSYLGGMSDAALAAAARLPRLAALVARGNGHLSAGPFAAALAACPRLQEVDACGCDGVTEEVVAAAVRALSEHPRPLALRLAGTAAAADRETAEFPTHRLLMLDLTEDRSNPHLRPDYDERVFDDSSEGSLQDLYDEQLEAMLEQEDDDDFFLDDPEFEDYDELEFARNAEIFFFQQS